MKQKDLSSQKLLNDLKEKCVGAVLIKSIAKFLCNMRYGVVGTPLLRLMHLKIMDHDHLPPRPQLLEPFLVGWWNGFRKHL